METTMVTSRGPGLLPVRNFAARSGLQLSPLQTSEDGWASGPNPVPRAHRKTKRGPGGSECVGAASAALPCSLFSLMRGPGLLQPGGTRTSWI